MTGTAIELRLTLQDRCDACGPSARSYAVAIVNSVRLDFCGHHFTKYEKKIRAVATRVLDLRHEIRP